MSSAAIPWTSDYRHPGGWDRDFPPTSMVDLFVASAQAHPQATLIDFLGRRYSYGETLDGARRVACGLAAMDIAKGDRVGLHLPNTPHYLAAYYGALIAGTSLV